MKKIVFIVALIVSQVAFAQDYKFGKVSKEELTEKANPTNPEANATVLYRSQKIYFDFQQGKGFMQKNEIHERIKIYNKDGFDQATKFVRLYVGSSNDSKEKLIGLKAVTYNLNGKKIEEDKLRSNGIFEEATNKYWETTKFTMPNVKEGSVIEYRYTIVSPFTGIDDIPFQQSIPIKKLDFELKTPEYYLYQTLLNPRASYIPKFTNTKATNSFTISSKERNISNRVVTASTTNKSTIDYVDNVVSASLDNIPALKGEEYVDNLGNYQSKLILELQSIQYPGEPIKNLATSWDKVTKTIYDNSDFGGELNKTGYFNKDVDALIASVSSPEEKTALIFDFVKAKVKWNDLHGYTTDLGVAKAYREGVGNIADINLMLVSMLRYAGIEANPILVSTKSNGIPLLPTRSGFNYVICAAELNGGVVYLDASEHYTTANILPSKTLNWLGRLIRENGTSEWVELIPKVSSREMVSISIKLNEDLSATGKVRNHLTNYQAARFRNKYHNFNKEEMMASLEKNRGALEVLEYDNKNVKDLSKPILQTYDFHLESALEEIGDKVYFSPMLFFASKENPFKEDTRNYPIDFVYPFSDKYIINMQLPEGYVVDTLTESSKIQFNGTEGEYTFLSNQKGNILQFTVSLDLNKSLVLASDYEQFKQFYQLKVEKELEKVVLKKG
ncbi:DUF3857 domain-containing protein [Oceanihabitans sediminis]|uniref:DUF3857 domain-containing protein n=1 Tax=Oceanihabitans sediminis TaxID=1812012 RepID=UPI00299D6F3E|nr:DUF3857 domain-containing protein [Oceanihabitans sediminis]MDX1278809.1 DUF3857 domain-containing protein [Oceanihabitans sediminis]